jgi:phospholipid/cholesterol/gamma-HCH transport system substrate-binding protein
MENKAHALIAGAFTLALLIAAVLLAMWFNRDRVERKPYEIATKLSVPGLSPQAAVRYRGLDVGKVDSIVFDPQVPGQILIRIAVDPATPVTHSTYAVLGYQGVTGIAYIQLNDDGDKPARLPTSWNDIARIEMRPSLFDQIENRGLAILRQTEEMARRVNSLLAPQNEAAILNTFENASRAAAAIESIPQQLQPTLSQLPPITRQLEQTLSSINSLAKDLGALTRNVNSLTASLQGPKGTLGRLNSAIDQIDTVAGEVGYDLLPRIDGLAGDARSTVRTLNRTLENFNERPQSILFGGGNAAPGPGEAGFSPPSN